MVNTSYLETVFSSAKLFSLFKDWFWVESSVHSGLDWAFVLFNGELAKILRDLDPRFSYLSIFSGIGQSLPDKTFHKVCFKLK